MERKKHETELDEEIREHLAREIELRMERGASREQAEAEARKLFGNMTLVKETTRAHWGRQWGEQLWLDARFALRTLAKTPGFTLAVLLTLALGIGLNTAMFSAVNSVLLRPLPCHDADRLMQLWETHPVIRRAQVSYPDFIDWRSRSFAFSTIAAYTFEGLQQFNLVVNNKPERIEASLVSENLLPDFGIQPRYGRNFRAEEMQPGHDNVALLSDSLWSRRFAADPNIIGRSIRIEGALFHIIGIVPRNSLFLPWADLLVPIARLNKEDLTSRKHHQLEVIGRLKPGVTLQQGQADLSRIAGQLERAYPATNKSIGVVAIPLQQQMTGPVRTPLLALLGAVGLILLIACANVANLLLARAIVRRKEIALRLTLGATGGRIVRQLLTESSFLAFAGAALGLAIAAVALRILRLYATQQLPRAAEIGIDARVLLFTLVLTLSTSLLCGLLPGWQAVRRDQNGALKEAGRTTAGSGARHSVRKLLVAVEFALALVVLTGAGLLVRSFDKVLSVDAGFRSGHLLTFQLVLSQAKYQTQSQAQSFYLRLLSNLEKLPSVKAVATVFPLPFTSTLNRTRFLVEGVSPPEAGRFPIAQARTVSPAYLHLMSIGLRAGREFTRQEAEWNAKPVCLINNTLSRRYFPAENPIGKNLLLGVLDAQPTAIQIIGVVSDTRDMNLTADPEPLIYFPGWGGSVVMRTERNPMDLANAVRRQVLSLDPEQPVAVVESMDKLLSASLSERRFSMLLFSAFAVLALVLAAIGLYSVVSYSVAQRTPEMGLRMALGAGRGQLFRSVLGESLLLSMAGLASGLILAFLSTRYLASLLFAVQSTDFFTFVSVSALVTTVGLLAAAVPAWRAATIDPIAALRHD